MIHPENVKGFNTPDKVMPEEGVLVDLKWGHRFYVPLFEGQGIFYQGKWYQLIDPKSYQVTHRKELEP